MPQADTFAIYTAAKIGAYEGNGSICLGSDSYVAHLQVLQERAGTTCSVQNRLLRRLFWLRPLSGTQLILSRVDTSLNPNDPLSRAASFLSRMHAMREADSRLHARQASHAPFVQTLEPLPWAFSR